jgi:hypothetical protein
MKQITILPELNANFVWLMIFIISTYPDQAASAYSMYLNEDLINNSSNICPDSRQSSSPSS